MMATQSEWDQFFNRLSLPQRAALLQSLQHEHITNDTNISPMIETLVQSVNNGGNGNSYISNMSWMPSFIQSLNTGFNGNINSINAAPLPPPRHAPNLQSIPLLPSIPTNLQVATFNNTTPITDPLYSLSRIGPSGTAQSIRYDPTASISNTSSSPTNKRASTNIPNPNTINTNTNTTTSSNTATNTAQNNRNPPPTIKKKQKTKKKCKG